jgi:hypothetical protein
LVFFALHHATTTTTTMSSTKPIILLDKKPLSDGLYTLLEDLSALLNINHDAPTRSPHQLVTATETLSAYIAEHHLRNYGCSKASLDPANLSFHSLRTRNPTEETIQVNEDGSKKITKGENDWYYLVLSETEDETGNVQILAEGALRKDKGESLEGFNGAVKTKVEAWEEAMKEKEKKGEEIMANRSTGKETKIEERTDDDDEGE